jgi:hypothetical protein
MIYDLDTQVTLAHPGITDISYSDSYDLIGGSDGQPALFGTGERLFMQFEVTTAFSGALGSPIASFGVAISGSATLTTDSHILGLTGGSITSGRVGFTVGQLTAGAKFHLPIPAWEDIMESDAGAWPNDTNAADLATFRGMRYMGIVCQNMEDIALNTFDAGAVQARIIKDPSGLAVQSNIYPSRMEVK